MNRKIGKIISLSVFFICLGLFIINFIQLNPSWFNIVYLTGMWLSYLFYIAVKEGEK